LKAQNTGYWATQLNEESFMLAGPVVGGGAGVGSIYYSPALISDNNKSNLSLNVSLFSVEQVMGNFGLADTYAAHGAKYCDQPWVEELADRKIAILI